MVEQRTFKTAAISDAIISEARTMPRRPMVSSYDVKYTDEQVRAVARRTGMSKSQGRVWVYDDRQAEVILEKLKEIAGQEDAVGQHFRRMGITEIAVDRARESLLHPTPKPQ